MLAGNEAWESRGGAAASLIRLGLEAAPVNVMIASVDGEILYLNQAARRMLARAEPAIRVHHPWFCADALAGTSLAAFLMDEKYRGELKEVLAGRHCTRVKLGRCTIDLTATPVFASDGERLGTVIEWTDAAQAEV
jgi:hypothetical protein